MVKEEYEMRKAGMKPSQEFLEKKRQMQQEQRENIEANMVSYEEHARKQLYKEQDKYLENIAEINKINAQLG